MRFTEEQLKGYAAPLSETENQKCLNAIGMVRDALKESGMTDDHKLIKSLYPDTYAYSLEMRSTSTDRKIKIFIQGSYANNTCVRMESDVDIAIIQEDIFQGEYRLGITSTSYGFRSASTAGLSFKDEIQLALTAKFGKDVKRGDKSIKVHGNAYRKDADTVPCRRLRDYTNDYRYDASNYIGGIAIHPDSGGTIINYPEQHIENGCKKNVDTNRLYKRMVRIIKKMRNLMEDYGYASSKEVTSFGLESLLWNIPDYIYAKYPTTYRFIFGEVVNCAYNSRHRLDEYKEANGIKMLCPTQADIANYQSFLSDLFNFYKYDI